MLMTPKTSVPNYEVVEDLGHIRRSETAARKEVAKEKAKERLESYAHEKGAHAVLGFTITAAKRSVDGYRVTVSGEAVKLEKLK